MPRHVLGSLCFKSVTQETASLAFSCAPHLGILFVHTCLSLPAPCLDLQLAVGVGHCCCLSPELPKYAALLSPCSIVSTGHSPKLAPHTLLLPSLRKHQPWGASSHQRVPPGLLQFSGSLCLSFSFCFVSSSFCLLPSVPMHYLADYLKCTDTGIMPRENGTNPTLLTHEQATGGLQRSRRGTDLHRAGRLMKLRN